MAHRNHRDGNRSIIFKINYMAQPITSADWKKRGGLTGKAFGQPLSSVIRVENDQSIIGGEMEEKNPQTLPALLEIIDELERENAWIFRVGLSGRPLHLKF